MSENNSKESKLTERAREHLNAKFGVENDEHGPFVRTREDCLLDKNGNLHRLGEVMASFAAEIQNQTREECAKVAEAHAATIGELCWNHENTNEAVSNCSTEIAAAIRDLERGGE